jgi:ADP-heptose:LPS heptosyltransferase
VSAPVAPPFHAGGVLPNVRKIGVLRANVLGDFIFALPAFEALHDTYPSAEIVLLGRAWHRALMNGRPGPIARVLTMPEGAIGDQTGVTADPYRVEQFLADARREEFDLAIQIHGGGRNSNPFLLKCGARCTIGLRTPEAAPLDRWVPYLYFQSETLRYLEVVALVGARTTCIEPRLRVTMGDVHESLAAAPEDSRPLVVLHPGASAPARRWPAQRFACVGDALAARGLRVVVTGVAAEAEVVSYVIGGMQAAAEDLCGRLSVSGLIGLLSRCALLVSNDTGPLHVAMAVGTPTVGIYWCGNMINAGPFSRRFNRPAVSWQVTCRTCGVNALAEVCPHGHPPIDDVTVDEVLGHALDLLDAR